MLNIMNPLKNMKVGLKLWAIAFFMLIPIMSLVVFLFTVEKKSDQLLQYESDGAEYLKHLKNIDLYVLQNRDINQSFFSADQHDQFTSLSSDLKHRIVKLTKLRLDPGLDTSLLLDMLVDTIPTMMTQIEKLRGLGTAIASRKVIMFEEEGMLNNITSQMRLQLSELNTSLEKIFIEQDNLKVTLQTLAAALQSRSETLLDITNKELVSAASMTILPKEYFDLATEVVTQFSAFYDAVSDSLQTDLQGRVSGATTGRNMQLLVALILTAVAILVGRVTSRYVTEQIGAIRRVFDSLDQGQYEARSEVHSTDELGSMAASLNDMLDRNLSLIQSQDERDAIQNAIMKLLDEVSDVAKGDLRVEAEITEDVTGAIADSFNHMIYQLRQIVANVHNATLQVSASANQIQSMAEQLAEGSGAQAEQIVDSSAALDEMAVSIQQVSENATLSATVAEQALANAKQGATAVQNTIQGMNRIRSQVQETSKRIKRLGERSQEISEIVQLIGDIADRTSILALNASIQAARAGEAGRSFAVVAEEVERLAERSTDATKQISSLVNTIQSETNEAVMAMEESTHEVVQGSQVADKAGQALGEIEGVSSRLAELIQSISLASTQQARGSDNLSKAMSEISEVTQQTATGTRQAASSISHLAALADELRDSVSTFKLPAESSQ